MGPGRAFEQPRNKGTKIFTAKYAEYAKGELFSFCSRGSRGARFSNAKPSFPLCVFVTLLLIPVFSPHPLRLRLCVLCDSAFIFPEKSRARYLNNQGTKTQRFLPRNTRNTRKGGDSFLFVRMVRVVCGFPMPSRASPFVSLFLCC